MQEQSVDVNMCTQKTIDGAVACPIQSRNLFAIESNDPENVGEAR
jgi:hypothetical protein